MAKKHLHLPKISYKDTKTGVFAVGDTIGIWEIDSNGKRTSCFPIMAFSAKKVELLRRHEQEILDLQKDKLAKKEESDEDAN